MTKIDIFSGFLGAGKTTLIKKLIQEGYNGEQLVLIENEFGEIGIDGGFLKDSGINITEMNSGCICCSLVGDFSKALQKVQQEYHPDRIVIEPSGVGKLSDVIKAVEKANLEDACLNAFCTVVDANKCKMYMKNFGEFFLDQVRNAGTVVLSHAENISEEKLLTAIELVKAENQTATVVSTPMSELTGKMILEAMENKNSLQAELLRLQKETEEDECCHHHHHDDDDDEDECCHHHHHDDDDDEDECCHHHHHDDDDDEDECCHHEHHHHHHHADEVFTSWGVETARSFTKEELLHALKELDSGNYGMVLRAKGIVKGDGVWYHFDFVPEEADVRVGASDVIGRLCVIGCKLDEEKLKNLFHV